VLGKGVRSVVVGRARGDLAGSVRWPVDLGHRAKVERFGATVLGGDANGGRAKYRALPGDRGTQCRELQPKRANSLGVGGCAGVVEHKLQAPRSPQQIRGGWLSAIRTTPVGAGISRDRRSECANSGGNASAGALKL